MTPQQVASQPRFAEVFDEISEFLADDVLVAHNAAFDTGVIKAALQASARSGPAFSYACTVILARLSYSLPSYSLPFVAEAAQVPLINHHDAIEDARACAGILIDIAAKHGAASVVELYQLLNLALPKMPAFVPDPLAPATPPAKVAANWFGWPEEGANPQANALADHNHPLFGQTVVFTGNLQISRGTAKQRAAQLGAQPASTVTGKTTVLVVGDGFIAADLRRGDTGAGRVTAKARRVLELHGKGQKIEVLSEGEFMQMIG